MRVSDESCSAPPDVPREFAPLLLKDSCGYIEQLTVIFAIEYGGKCIPVLVWDAFAIEPLANCFFRLANPNGHNRDLQPAEPTVVLEEEKDAVSRGASRGRRGTEGGPRHQATSLQRR